MSSTNRGGDRHAADYYITPQWAIRDFLTALCEDAPELFGRCITKPDDAENPLVVLDPCAGGDDRHEMAYPKAIEAFNEYHSIARVGTVKHHLDVQVLRTVDLREDSPAQVKADFLTWDVKEMMIQPDLIITNPPFDRALEIIKKSLRDVRGGGLVVMLLRLNFFGSQDRKKWLQENMPVVAFVHSKRMGFVPEDEIERIKAEAKTRGEKPKGIGGDSIEYMHAVWQQGVNPKYTRLRVI